MKGHKEHHHHHPRAEHAKGGHVDSPKRGTKVHDKAPKEVYAGAGSHVVHEAEEHKRGGKVHKHKAKKHHLGHVEGHKAHHRADRAPRKSGGRAGSNMNPLSSAHHGTAPKGHHEEMN